MTTPSTITVSWHFKKKIIIYTKLKKDTWRGPRDSSSHYIINPILVKTLCFICSQMRAHPELHTTCHMPGKLTVPCGHEQRGHLIAPSQPPSRRRPSTSLSITIARHIILIMTCTQPRFRDIDPPETFQSKGAANRRREGCSRESISHGFLQQGRWRLPLRKVWYFVHIGWHPSRLNAPKCQLKPYDW